MKNFIDLSGGRFGSLLVTRRVPSNGRILWHCICDCGNEVVKAGADIRAGDTKSCGCLRSKTVSKRASERNTKHGIIQNRIVPRWYQIWLGMMKRCYNKESPAYINYGARGITVCDRWHDPKNFLADMGEPPAKYSVNRLNNDEGYSPKNCNWATDVEQANNRRSNRYVIIDGNKMTIAEAAKHLGLLYTTLYMRIKRNPNASLT
jgi:hypothetical protein